MLPVYLSYFHVILKPPFSVQLLKAKIFITQHPLGFFVTTQTCLEDKIPHYLKHQYVIEQLYQLYHL